MRFRWQYLAAIAAAILVLLLTWFLPIMFHVSDVNALVLRLGTLLLGGTAILGLLLWARANQPPIPAVEDPTAKARASFGGALQGGAASQDVDVLVRDASAKVAAARLAAGAKLASLPTVFVLGETGSGKTSAVDQSGLDAELLAGQVYQEASIVPTRVANIWFARKTVFVEAGGPLMDDPASWVRLVKHFIPGSLGSVFGGGSKAPRAAVVCVDCEKLVRESALEKIVAQARKVRARLEELSYHLGISLPVYVIFNRSDRIPYFEEFAGTFSNEETAQVLGSTLPLLAAGASGVYAEQESKRLTASFQGMFSALAECRPGLLSRERNADRQGGIYEFPREFSKLSKPLVQFLVDLCRPGHLRTGPFLRGFYFAGQRVVTVSAGAQTMVGPRSSPQRSAGGFSADATSLISAQDTSAKTSWSTGTSLEGMGESRRSLQRVFLSHIFSHVILQDRAALGASGRSVRGDVGRRILFATLGFLCFLWMIFTTISWAGNTKLVSSVRDAGDELSAVKNLGATPPNVDSLRRLDSLRKTLVELRQYDAKGAPFSLRWGLYTGGDILPDSLAIYFHAFDNVLFQHAKQNLLADLKTYSGVPQPNADWVPPYDSLKAYLLTTSEYKRNSTTGEFLQNFLMKDWKRDLGELDQEHTDLAAQQFAFYSSQLSEANPLSSSNDPVLIAQVRGYLNGFTGTDRLYNSMLNDARQKAKPYRFALAHPDALDAMHGGSDVDAAFTADGWKVMDQSLQNPKRLQAEDWVLGPGAVALPSIADLSAQLRTRYDSDYIKAWRAFLKSSAVLRYKDIPDAANKLSKLSSNSSPLLALLCDSSDGTNVNSSNVKQAFSAPQFVETPGCGTTRIYMQQNNGGYMKGLLDLQTCIQDIADAPPDQKEAKKAGCVPRSQQAQINAKQLEQLLTNDTDAHIDKTVSELLDAPITYLQPLLGASDSGGSGGICGQFKGLQSAYPFNARSSRDITLDEFNGVFQPNSGVLSKFIDAHKNDLSLQGHQYVRSLTSNVSIGPNFLRALNELYAIQQAVYANGAKDPHFEYSISARIPEVGSWKSEKLTIDGQTWSVPEKGGTQKFVWPGVVTQGASLTLNPGNQDIEVAKYPSPGLPALWSVAHFFNAATYKWQQPSASSTIYIIQGPLIGLTGQPMQVNGQQVIVRFDVDLRGVPFFQAGYLSNYACPAMNK